MYLITTIIPVLFVFIILYKYDTYEIYLNSNSNLITNYIYKVSNYWSLIENNLFFLSVILVIIITSSKNNKINVNTYSLLIMFILMLVKYFNFYLNSNLFNSNNAIFNPLLTHFLVFIHPPLILISLLILKTINLKQSKIKLLFYFFSFTLFLGSYWATSVFGWGGWWSWDPIENISLVYWFLFFLYIHKVNKISVYYYIYIFTADFFLFFFLKFNNFQSIHIFKIIYINLQLDFIIVYCIFFFIFCYNILKNKKSNIKFNIMSVANAIIVTIIFVFILYIYVYININSIFMFYILLYLSIIVYLFFLYIINIKNVYTIYSILFIIILLLYEQNIYIYLCIYSIIIYSYMIEKKIKIYKNHVIYIIIIYIIYNITNEIEETIIQIINNYSNGYNNNKIIELDININYIEYINKNKNIFISNYYNIYNIFEKIEFSIYNYIISNQYYNIKNNIIQIYKLNYIAILFYIILYKMVHR